MKLTKEQEEIINSSKLSFKIKMPLQEVEKQQLYLNMLKTILIWKFYILHTINLYKFHYKKKLKRL